MRVTRFPFLAILCFSATAFAASGFVPATIISPAKGSVLPGSVVTFQWEPGGGVSDYWLCVSSVAVGKCEIYDIPQKSLDQGPSYSHTLAGLPTDGRTIYVRLWSQNAVTTDWYNIDYTYVAAGGSFVPATMSSPVDGSDLLSSTASFQWTPGAGVSDYWLYIGNAAVGGSELYNADQGTSLSHSISGLPADGSTIYVRLASKNAATGNWFYVDYSYVAAGPFAPATLIAPASGTTFISSTMKFQWTAGTGVSDYWLFLSNTAPGNGDIYNAEQGTARSRTVTGLPVNGSPVYVRVGSKNAATNAWVYQDYTYTAFTATGNTVTFLGIDQQTSGDWPGVYGQDGNIIAGSSAVQPSYSTWDPQNTTNSEAFQTFSLDPRALPQPKYNLDPLARIVSHLYSRLYMSIKVTDADHQPHRIALYFCDWQPGTPLQAFPQKRSITVRARDTDSSAILDTRILNDYTAGLYLVYNYTGNITFHIANNYPPVDTDGLTRDLPNGSVTAFFWGGQGLPANTTPPSLSVALSHAGSFRQGQTGATYNAVVSNAAGAGSTSKPVTVTETVPGGLTLVSMSGAGWNCSANTCTRSDALPAGASYGSITVTVSVAANAPSVVVNSAAVSGGTSATNQASDSTTITPSPPALSIAKSHTGNFTQGQTGAVYSVTVSNAAGAGPTAGTVTVTETVPAGLTLVSMAGTGWTCAAGANTCTRSDALNGGSGFPPIAVTVNVAANAAAQVTNQVSVAGGGSATATASDPTSVNSNNCTATVSPTVFGAAGTGGTLTLTFNGAGCGWTATSNAPWLTPAAPSGTSATLSVTVAANTTGAQRVGTLTVAGQTVTVTQAVNNTSQIPSLVSLNPFQGTGLNANLTFVYSHPSGWAAIKSAEFIMNPRWETTARAGGCYIRYAPGTDLFTLIGDDGNSVAGTTIPGSTVNISNSQCTLNAASSSATGNGNNLTLVAALTFSPTFTGQRHIWMQAADYNNFSTNWLVYGVWNATQTTVNANPWYRIYDPFSNSYLYTADKNEYDTLGARGFAQQGVSGLVMDGATTVGSSSNIAWYRVFVVATNSHFWTSDRNEFLSLVNAQQAYVGEGVAAFVMPYINAQGQVSPRVTNTIPFYRAAYQGKNLHFWTSDADEYNGTNGKHLPAGYVGEGIASYIFPASGAQFTSSAMAAQDDTPAVVSAGNGVVAPGQTLSIYGRHLAGRIWMNGAPARVIAARDNEIEVLVPEDLAGAAEVTLEIEHRGRRSEAAKLGVVPANPAIFGTNQYGRGHAQARNADGTANDVQHPAARGSVVTLYTTGIGELPVEAHIGGRPADVLSTRMSSTRAGVVEVQVRVPEGVDPAGFQPVVLHTGDLFSQPGIGLAIR